MQFLLFVGAGNSLAQEEVAVKFQESVLVLPNIHLIEGDSSAVIKTVSQMGSSLKLAQFVGKYDDKIETISKLITQKDFSVLVLNDKDKTKTINWSIKDLMGTGGYLMSEEYFGLSPIINKKRKVDEFFLAPDNSLFQTVWVHDFRHWITKDRHMPKINAKAGMLPPKIARSMINLLPFDGEGKVFVDPFCGSGRILVEAAEMGFKVLGTDVSTEQVDASRKNLEALHLPGEVRVHDATHLSEIVSEVDAIVTEPFLGKPGFRPDQAKYIAPGLQKLYLGCLKDWYKALKSGGVIVMIFPILKGTNTDYKTSKIIDEERFVGYNQLKRGITYSRPGAGVIREIVILQKI